MPNVLESLPQGDVAAPVVDVPSSSGDGGRPPGRPPKPLPLPRDRFIMEFTCFEGETIWWRGDAVLTIGPRRFGDYADRSQWWSAYAIGYTVDWEGIQVGRPRSFLVGYGARPWDALAQLLGIALEVADA